MRELSQSEISGYLLAGESRNVEFKPEFLWTAPESKKLKEEVIKTIIAMSNTPNGGVILIGITHLQQTDGILYEYSGVSPRILRWYEQNGERVQRDVHSFCSVPADFQICFGLNREDENARENTFIVIKVNEFSTVPVITVANSSAREDTGSGNYIILSDNIYTRSFNATWSSKRCTHKELEDIIKMAADKYRVGLKLRGYVKLDSLEVKLKEERSEYEQ